MLTRDKNTTFLLIKDLQRPTKITYLTIERKKKKKRTKDRNWLSFPWELTDHATMQFEAKLLTYSVASPSVKTGPANRRPLYSLGGLSRYPSFTDPTPSSRPSRDGRCRRRAGRDVGHWPAFMVSRLPLSTTCYHPLWYMTAQTSTNCANMQYQQRDVLLAAHVRLLHNV